jgi:amino acid transporter
VNTVEVQTALNFFLTLVSIIGTFFYVQLSNWYRELLEVEEKFKLNKLGDDRLPALLECRFQLQRLYNHVPVMVSALVTVFLIVIGLLALSLGTQLQPSPPILPYYWIAGAVFYAIYLFLTGYFLIKGYRLGWQLKVDIDKAL